MAGWPGREPGTHALKGRYSTDWVISSSFLVEPTMHLKYSQLSKLQIHIQYFLKKTFMKPPEPLKMRAVNADYDRDKGFFADFQIMLIAFWSDQLYIIFHI